MKINQHPCHGTAEYLNTISNRRNMGSLLKIHQKYRSYIVWWVENLGWRAAFKHILIRLFKPYSRIKNQPLLSEEQLIQHHGNDALGLQPGELVEVKSAEEIMATLNLDRRHKSLRCMTGMRKHCGKQYRVLKRVERIIVEDNGELRKLKNTVLLDGCMCDGKDFGDCDRSCFYFWREAWLKRIS
jgi:hypothetical protein